MSVPADVRSPGGRTCSTCRFWRAGFCCRFPPSVDPQPPFRFAVFPETTPDDWCGEYRAEAEPTVERRAQG